MPQGIFPLIHAWGCTGRIQLDPSLYPLGLFSCREQISPEHLLFVRLCAWPQMNGAETVLSEGAWSITRGTVNVRNDCLIHHWIPSS